MKHSARWGFLLFTFVSGLAVPALHADVENGVNPGYVRVKVYKVRVSPNTDCSNSILIQDNGSSAAYTDWTTNPVLGSGAIPDGSYPCVMIQMSDNIKFTPSVTNSAWSHGVCTPGTEYTLDVGHDSTAVNPDGTSVALGAEGTDNTVWMYARTLAPDSNESVVWDPSQGIRMSGPLVVSGDSAGTIVFNFNNKIGEENRSTWQCGCDAPAISFR